MRRDQPAWKDVMSRQGLDDMTLLSKISNEEISKNLKERFDNNIIYTNIGDVLVSVNPYQFFPIYGVEIMHDYVGRSRVEVPPHIYGVAEQAYRSMILEKENQCILISGESGAGKTEAAKKVMEFIAEVSGKGEGEKAQSAANIKRLEMTKNVVLESNPLLEAFGNAKTLRNNNSSRFGKYFEIQFTRSGEPDGGCIINYLLEKSRVVTCLNGERNFHIFYQFCAGASAQERQDFGVHNPDAYEYCSKGNCFTVDNVDDAAEWNDVRHAMNVIGITADEQYEIFRLIAAILWLGNVEFHEVKADRAEVADMAVLEFVANLLGVPPPFLKTALEIREMETKHGMQRGTTYKVPLNLVQAQSTRDALAKAIYDKIFDWLVLRINKAMVKMSKETLSIGVLDIYGFEVFDKNGFEQFCINYVNEKLQQIFIEFTLRLEQEEYVREGIQWTPIDFFNNKIVCDLIEEKKPPGIFLVLDDVCKASHAVDEVKSAKAFSDRLQSCASNPHFQGRGNAFCVKHYAGDVVYECIGIVEKNKDTLFNDLLQAISISKSNFLKGLFAEECSNMDTKKAPTTAGFKIRTQANDLVRTLSKAMPHYVRCLKPNDSKQASVFDGKRVLHQVKYLGLLDNVKVRRAGFAYRTTFQKFMGRYYLLSSQTSYAAKNIWKGDDITGCRAILNDQPFGPDQWQIGKTKVFIRAPESLFALEDLRVNYYHNMVSRVKNAYRIWKNFKHECSNRIKNAWKTYKHFKVQCAIIIQKCYRSYKDVAPYSDLRMKVEPNFVNKKERNRMSMVSVRKFYGDYLEVRARKALMDAMGPQAATENIIFSSKSNVIHHPGLLRANKMSPRFLVLTDRNLYLVQLKEVKKQRVHVLDRSIPIGEISGAVLSPFADNFVVLQNATQFWDVGLELEFKTELVAWLSARGSVGSNITFMDKIEYYKSKKSKNKITFVKDDSGMFKSAEFKKDKIKIATGMPASSSPASFLKTGFKFIGVGGGEPVVAAPAAAAPRGGGGGRGAPRGGGGGAAPRGGGGAAPRGGAAAAPRGGGGGGAAPRGGGAARGGAGAGAARGGGGGGGGGGGAARGGAAPRGGGAARGGRGGGAAAPAAKKCRALYPYEPVEPDELTLREGDLITIVEKEGEWWRGHLDDGVIGLFPANYVQEL